MTLPSVSLSQSPALDVLTDFIETQLNDSQCDFSYSYFKLLCKQSAARLTTRGAGSLDRMPEKNR